MAISTARSVLPAAPCRLDPSMVELSPKAASPMCKPVLVTALTQYVPMLLVIGLKSTMPAQARVDLRLALSRHRRLRAPGNAAGSHRAARATH